VTASKGAQGAHMDRGAHGNGQHLENGRNGETRCEVGLGRR
jgi:hypothetical protein